MRARAAASQVDSQKKEEVYRLTATVAAGVRSLLSFRASEREEKEVEEEEVGSRARDVGAPAQERDVESAREEEKSRRTDMLNGRPVSPSTAGRASWDRLAIVRL